ncbi:ADP-ribose pyrophosphatase [Mariprofundus ferrinatatus]|uniref:ADP-ribose pyrophosphatase n=1 Tax=Mariprofundus ferrinatatus TaxID=1921087 RepID=A0A2K8L0Q5_9PROT|nr:NUDIX domain-containing protein [Mariprofundus ferrinatatus]ATX80890.1 ADP-ribose pyrophosphatase [Mariprofundus ferrinatatus]
MEYHIKKSERVYQGFFAMDRHTVEHDRFDGGSLTVTRENMERGDAAALLLYDPNADEVLLLEQFRIGPVLRNDNPWLVEIVAGIIDKGENAEEAVIRESREEAGFIPYETKFLGRYYTTPGGCSERIDLFLGLVDKNSPVGDGGGCDHEYEDIRLAWVSRQEALDMLDEGRIASGAPMLALLLAFGWKGVVGEED